MKTPPLLLALVLTSAVAISVAVTHAEPAGDAPHVRILIAEQNYGPNHARIFHTSLGHKEDFDKPAFSRLLRNGAAWASKGE
ncbi:MAG: hypothetical protein WD342_01630 [Verrucomicrobiales bacterium]